MDFEEFLWAAGEDMLAQEIRNTFESLTPLPESIHRKALGLSDLYLFLGGMPAVLNAYFPQKNIAYADEKKNDLLNAYLADIAKYASPDETSRILGAFRSIPKQLAKENHKFQYKTIQKGASSFAAIAWINRCCRWQVIMMSALSKSICRIVGYWQR
jgi:predicted AAA+ superfamily ATPase